MEKALDYYKQALAVFEKTDAINDIVLNIGNIGAVYMEQKKFAESEKYLKKALHYSDSLDLLFYQKDNHYNLSELYEHWEKPALALEHYKAFVAARDSIYNEDNTKTLVRSEMNFEFEKKQALEKAEQDKKDALEKEKREREAIIRNFLIGGFIIVLLLALALLRQYKSKQKANWIIVLQKAEVEKRKEEVERQRDIIGEKQKEILDSIYYARRIQQSLMPTDKYIDKNLKRLNKKK